MVTPRHGRQTWTFGLARARARGVCAGRVCVCGRRARRPHTRVRATRACAGDARAKVVYVGGPDAFFALDADSGAAKWNHTVGKLVGSSPVLAEDRVFVGAEDGYLYAFAR